MSTRERTAAAVSAAAAFAALVMHPKVRRKARRVGRFARPLRGAALPPVPPALPPGQVVNLPGRGEVFARDSGGPPGAATVLLLHGWTASADLNFFQAYTALAESYRVIALDLRGHGRGMRSVEPFTLEDCADDAAALLSLLGASRVIAVGYSMGGPVALLLARRHPGLVAALVMQATALEWRHTARERMVWRMLSVFELGLRLGTGAGLAERILRQTVEDQPELGAYRPWLAAEFRRGLARELADAGRALSRYDASPWAAQLGLPAVVLVTTRDRLVRPAKQQQLAEALRAQVIEIDGDHDLPLVNGADYARLTRLAVDTVAAAAAHGAARAPRQGRGRGRGGLLRRGAGA